MVDGPIPRCLQIPAELGRNRDLIGHGLERLADELFVGERAVHLGGVEERHAQLDRSADQPDHLLLIPGRAVA
jgi:hypothetical protein